MWGIYKENGFWLAKRSKFKIILNIQDFYIAIGRFRFRLVLLENSKEWF